LQSETRKPTLVQSGKGFLMLKQHPLYLSTLSTLLLASITLLAPALAASPETGSLGERQAAIEQAIDWFQDQQAADGSIGGQNTGKSCEVTWVVSLAGENPDGPAWTPDGISLLDACERDVPAYLTRRDVGRMGKVLRAVVAAGANPHNFGGLDLIAEIESKYNPSIGLYDPVFLFRQDIGHRLS